MIFLADYTLKIVALGSALLGIVAGSLGTFAVLRKQSLLGDSISHAALPGIVLAFMITEAKAPSSFCWVQLLPAGSGPTSSLGSYATQGSPVMGHKGSS